jgi:ribosomal protein S18 acetylase RimI-like enzyme
MMIRQADMTDIDLLVQIDLNDEGVTSTTEAHMTEDELRQHREKIMRFVTEKHRGALIYEDKDNKKRIGLIMYSFINREEEYPWKTIFHELDRRLFQEDGRFVEIFQLWVHPDYRRSGVATKLKQTLEEVARTNGVNLIYTHTEERNSHVIALNMKLGYKEVRRGAIWDEITRVSLIKHL